MVMISDSRSVNMIFFSAVFSLNFALLKILFFFGELSSDQWRSERNLYRRRSLFLESLVVSFLDLSFLVFSYLDHILLKKSSNL